jgi:malate/lactate dehydrogenase
MKIAVWGAGAIGSLDPKQREAILRSARDEVVEGANRVKAGGKGSTLHPIVEGAVEVAAAIAFDRRSILTVSVLDRDRELYYSLPCTLGRAGVVEKHLDLLQTSEIQAGLEICREGLRATLRQTEG